MAESSIHDRTPLIKACGSSSSTTDNQGRHHVQERHTSKTAATLCILITELCERMTYFGITANLVPFCKEILGMSHTMPTTVALVFQGTCYFIPVLGGWIADKYTGRFNLILLCSLIYLVGTILLSVIALDNEDFKKIANGGYLEHSCKIVYFVIAMVFLAFGTGGIKSNVSPFGADQVRDQGPKEVQTFFNWFYWFINIGAFFSFTVIVYLQQEYGFFYGNIISTCSLLLGIIAFCASRNKYIMHPPGGSTLGDVFKVIWLAIKRTRNSQRPVPHIKGESWLDRAKETRGGHFTDKQVEDTKTFLRIMPIFLMFIIYWLLFLQMQTSVLIQAEHMKINFGINIPAASLPVVFIAFALILIPLMDKVVYPLLRYMGINFTPLRRIGVGFLFLGSAFIVAGLVEIKRRERFQSGHFVVQTLFNKQFNASDLPVFYQVPQFMLIGCSEAFASVTALEFAYSQAPKSVQGVTMGFFLITTGIGSYFASALESLVSWARPAWYPEDNPNYGNFENYFFLLAGLMVLNFLSFVLIAYNYKYVDLEEHEMPQDNEPNWDVNNTQEHLQLSQEV